MSFHPLTLSWRRSLSYRNQFINLQSKSLDWFLYDKNLHHKRVKSSITQLSIDFTTVGSIIPICRIILEQECGALLNTTIFILQQILFTDLYRENINDRKWNTTPSPTYIYWFALTSYPPRQQVATMAIVQLSHPHRWLLMDNSNDFSYNFFITENFKSFGFNLTLKRLGGWSIWPHPPPPPWWFFEICIF